MSLATPRSVALKSVGLVSAATLVGTIMAATPALAATVSVKSGATLTLRTSPSTAATALVNIPNKASLSVACKMPGTSVTGSQGTTSYWSRVTYSGKTGYVSAAYLAGGAASSVPLCGVVSTNGATLTVRSSPSTSAAALTTIRNGAVVALKCRAAGTTIAGSQGTTSTWDKVTVAGKTGYVSAAYVRNGVSSAVPSCGGTPTAPPKTGASVRGGAIKRSEIINRAKYWYNNQPGSYNQSGYAYGLGGDFKYRRDCSGYVSMAWHLNANAWTGSLADKYTVRLSSLKQLKSGDILNSYYEHVVIFDKWLDSGKTKFGYYTFGSTPVKYRTASIYQSTLDSHRMSNYVPRRYVNVRD